MQVQAKAKSLKVPPRKLNLVAGLVRGRDLSEAVTILEHTPRQAARLLKAVIKSAQANAEHNFKLPSTQLKLAQIAVTPGLVQKRWRAASGGSTHTIRHRTSNLTVVVENASDKQEVVSKAQNKPAKSQSTARKVKSRKSHGPKS